MFAKQGNLNLDYELNLKLWARVNLDFDFNLNFFLGWVGGD